jgi:WD40 repeat protein
LFTCSNDKHVKRISVENREVDKDFGQVCDGWISAIKITADDEKLLVGDNGGQLKLILSRDGEVIKEFGLIDEDFGKAHDNFISGIVITVDQKFFFTSSVYGVLKQWNYEDNTLVKDHGNIMDYISSLCL